MPNNEEKLSSLKGLVTHSHGKRRFKGDLTLDMISPPLGDFRHTMHVGRGGDVFGDTSFLSNHGGPANGNNGETDSISSPDNKIGAFFSRTLRHIRRGSDNRPTGGSKDLSPPPPVVSPIIKNAISLPRLDVDVPNGSPTAKVLFPSSQSTPEEMKSSYGLESGFVTLPRLSRSERQQPSISLPTSCSPNIHRGSLTDPTDAILSTCPTTVMPFDPKLTSTAYSDSLPSLMSLDTFTFDLGPSLMSEVFGLIDGHPEESGHAWEGEEAGSAFGLTTEGSEMDSATISYVDSLQREDCGGRKSPHGPEWEEEEVNGVGLSDKVPEVASLGSPDRGRLGLGMESERFQSAADVLARHYGVGHSKGRSRMEVTDSEAMTISEPRNKIPYSYMDDEDEIKV
uniref:CDC42 effector protein (Rho GTPase binding) 1a n=2 Tax=Gasterosteus aculeatus TaxID=69293 RepID=A0AAQ4QCK1_GASAC|nr:cdc42 effector protein 1 [Gasterosteus aculeatus aculeatus]XP_040033556.1 cdc42 effector protein 1 [Gasterosteus aculeatus aculeatus]XP_040033557.1 cdc42 effector protein 1 [Gasterosteus aculeatus aculeatus]XP_040033558.1 cdc42 effector protein 1 [Gasterosteus aculeatus aculeatus]XP_040033559.1 cdc42 effector protein 1 [Gasterosteus aculeatus aculeatus]XP_040033560.1 cdc42 effector protein 1 [Gasterosteus aculeatus aculeatus]